MEKAIIVKNVSKKYKLYKSTKERLLDIVSPKNYGEDFYALNNVNFIANKGEVIGFVGINGSGKSTLSNIISGIVPESSGEVIINGEVAIIAVNAGLNNELTGRDNIELKLLMLGFDKNQIKELEDEIIEFSELEQFIDQPVKSYSSGMKSRLGFAISVNIDPDILVIDEALSVGDKAFAEKSLAKMKEFKEKGKTMIFVSHSLNQMREFCDKILWLEFGRVRDYGDVDEILPKYEDFLRYWRQLDNQEKKEYRQIIRTQGFYQIEKLSEIITDPIVEDGTMIIKEKLISKVARIKSNHSYIYFDVNDLSNRKTIQNLNLGKQTFYIKKQVHLNNEKLFLLSKKPSYKEGVIGWINAKDVIAHNLIFIDQDMKEFEIIGGGRAYKIPWGSENDVIYENLTRFLGKKFTATRTERIRNSIWYRGIVDNKEVWIHEKRLKSLEEN